MLRSSFSSIGTGPRRKATFARHRAMISVRCVVKNSSSRMTSAYLARPIEPRQHRADAAGRQRDAGVGGTVINVQRVTVGADGGPTGKRDVANVAEPLVRRLGTEDPRVAAREAVLGVLEIEQR